MDDHENLETDQDLTSSFKSVNPKLYNRININSQQKIREGKEAWMK